MKCCGCNKLPSFFLFNKNDILDLDIMDFLSFYFVQREE